MEAKTIEEKTGVLHRITSTHQRLRTDCVNGTFIDPPAIGRRFFILGAPLVPDADGRLIRTALVESVEEEKPGTWRFTTANSSYRLTVEVPS